MSHDMGLDWTNAADVERVPELLRLGDDRFIRREQIDKLTDRERRELWFEAPGADGKDTAIYFPFMPPLGVFAWKPGDPR